mmetsp:Transcript_3351/g.7032  ORF Transcript_3351/g.7032 Transcript_3351/m.7032 type:complete len:210 (-) Transcript_3351:384-1013(-)
MTFGERSLAQAEPTFGLLFAPPETKGKKVHMRKQRANAQELALQSRAIRATEEKSRATYGSIGGALLLERPVEPSSTVHVLAVLPHLLLAHSLKLRAWVANILPVRGVKGNRKAHRSHHLRLSCGFVCAVVGVDILCRVGGRASGVGSAVERRTGWLACRRWHSRQTCRRWQPRRRRLHRSRWRQPSWRWSSKGTTWRGWLAHRLAVVR